MMVRHKETVRDEIMSATRQQLLAAAAQEFAEKGFVGANVNRIANAAGFSIGTFYNYFPSKRDLMLAFIDEIGQLHVDFMVDQVKQEAAPRRRMGAFFNAGFVFVEAHLTQSRAIFNTLNGPDEEFKLRLYQVYQPLFQLLGDDILAPGMARGDFRQVDQGPTAGLIMLIYLGTGSQFGPEGALWLDPMQVADFVFQALRREK
jgi:AcrR family transcriptional regulator